MADRTVGEIVAERPAQSRIFQSYAIDFCCQGAKTLRQACEAKGVSLDAIVDQLEAELRDKEAPEFNPATFPPALLAEYIEQTHHQFLKDELPRVGAMAARVAQVHGRHTPSLVEVNQIFIEMAEDMFSHMNDEEEMLFPLVKSLVKGEKSDVSLDGPIGKLLAEHEHAGGSFERLREITNGYQPPAEACNTYRALFAGLLEIEEDMHRHIHLENSVLFPAAQRLIAG